MEFFCLLDSPVRILSFHPFCPVSWIMELMQNKAPGWLFSKHHTATLQEKYSQSSFSKSKRAEKDPTTKHLKLIFEGHKQQLLFPATTASKSSKVEGKVSESGDHIPCIEKISTARACLILFLVCWLVRITAWLGWKRTPRPPSSNCCHGQSCQPLTQTQLRCPGLHPGMGQKEAKSLWVGTTDNSNPLPSHLPHFKGSAPPPRPGPAPGWICSHIPAQL